MGLTVEGGPMTWIIHRAPKAACARISAWALTDEKALHPLSPFTWMNCKSPLDLPSPVDWRTFSILRALESGMTRHTHLWSFSETFRWDILFFSFLVRSPTWSLILFAGILLSSSPAGLDFASFRAYLMSIWLEVVERSRKKNDKVFGRVTFKDCCLCFSILLVCVGVYICHVYLPSSIVFIYRIHLPSSSIVFISNIIKNMINSTKPWHVCMYVCMYMSSTYYRKTYKRSKQGMHTKYIPTFTRWEMRGWYDIEERCQTSLTFIMRSVTNERDTSYVYLISLLWSTKTSVYQLRWKRQRGHAQHIFTPWCVSKLNYLIIPLRAMSSRPDLSYRGTRALIVSAIHCKASWAQDNSINLIQYLVCLPSASTVWRPDIELTWNLSSHLADSK